MFAIEGGDRISEKQRVFAEAYLRCLNEAKAYSEAYGTMDASVAAKRGASLLKKPEIKEYIDKKTEEEKAGVQTDKVIELLQAIAFTSPADFVRIDTEGGKQKIVWQDIDTMPKDAKKAICAIKNTPSGICIETLDRMKAIDLLMKYTDRKTEGGSGVIIEGNVE
ncbi:MAG: terminase small subunit [Clostridia bacterium]|nr:terminase small subunit [Clostridia bacterium]